MSDHTLFVCWDRPLVGREIMAQELFAAFMNHLESARKSGAIDSYEPVLLEARGSTVNGYLHIRGDRTRLNDFLATDQWEEINARAHVYLQGFGVVHGITGGELQKRMRTFQKYVGEIR